MGLVHSINCIYVIHNLPNNLVRYIFPENHLPYRPYVFIFTCLFAKEGKPLLGKHKSRELLLFTLTLHVGKHACIQEQCSLWILRIVTFIVYV